MGMKKLLMTVMWTEILDAMNSDWPEINIPKKAGPKLSKVISENAQYIIDITGKES